MSGWVCQWKPFWITVGESFQKAYLEEWVNRGTIAFITAQVQLHPPTAAQSFA